MASSGRKAQEGTRLKLREIEYLEDGIGRTPREQVDGLAAMRGRKRRRSMSDADRAAFCSALIQELKSWLSTSTGDKARLAAFSAIGASPSTVMRAFHILTVGYDSRALRSATTRAKREHARLLKLVAAKKQRHSRLESRAGDGTTKALHRLYVARLDALEKEVGDYFQDPGALALQWLNEERARRRYGNLTPFAFRSHFSDVAGLFEIRIERFDAAGMFFPFRFCRTLPLSLLRQLRSDWTRGGTLDMMRSRVEAEISWPDIFKEMRATVTQLSGALAPSRAIAIEELESCWDAQYYLATATLAVTQVEGVLWDFATHLNARGTRIYGNAKGARFPYRWDHAAGAYTDFTPGTKRPVLNVKKSRPLLSARALLISTRMVEFITPDVHTFLVSEHYRDRCIYAHGSGDVRDNRSDAVMALLCLHEVLRQIQGRVAPGRT